jgi:hypothetical protein
VPIAKGATVVDVCGEKVGTALEYDALNPGPGLSRCRDHANLLYDARLVSVPPELHQFAARDAEDVDSRHRRRLARWGNTHVMSAGRVVPIGYID